MMNVQICTICPGESRLLAQKTARLKTMRETTYPIMFDPRNR
ncbi:hypothetical protein B4099_1146 [Heyndrickxia coagulans]|uniref:Uncharacterized protein n=1 Tax=Heyndrickxia coagulans TaxID=1398 RepID=A0A150KH60_HEYCO|nr:hypothetical protein B4099_1146 [Heyndrickxia coagulans]